MIVSTKAGLYRYDMADIVVAGPGIRNTPTIQLLQKTSGIISIKELADRVESLRAGLISEGLSGAHIAVIGETSIDWMTLYLAAVSRHADRPGQNLSYPVHIRDHRRKQGSHADEPQYSDNDPRMQYADKTSEVKRN